jgi:hypothetical protein
LLDYTREELLLEYFEDAIDEDPTQAYPSDVAESGAFVRPTGDPVVDEWERVTAAGGVPDVLAAFSSEERAKLEKVLGKKKIEPEPPEEFSDRYDDG